jgi:hypothetical protein
MPVFKEFEKNKGLEELLSVSETESLFIVSDSRPECAIQNYTLRDKS